MSKKKSAPHVVPDPPPVPEAVRIFDALPDAAFVRLPTVALLFGVSPATIWRRVASGDLPAPCRLGPRTTTWQVGPLREKLRALAAGGTR